MNLFDYTDSINSEILTDKDYDEVFTKEASKHSSFKELEESIDNKLLPEFTKWATRIALDKNKLKSLFSTIDE